MKYKLFCIPHAGGSAFIFNQWKFLLKPEIELIPVELSGHGNRLIQPNYNNIDDAVSDIYDIIKKNITNELYMIFGHSMGALLLFELYYKILNSNEMHLPFHLFFSGTKPPHIHENEWDNLTDDEIAIKLRDYGGINENIFNNKELFNLFFPVIKNDLLIYDSYRYYPKPELIKCNSTVMSGANDKLVPLEKLTEWKKMFSDEVTIKIYPGEHFFLFDNKKEIINYINSV